MKTLQKLTAHRKKWISAAVIVTGIAFLMALRQYMHVSPAAIGYLYVPVITMGVIGFGFRGGLAVAGISCAVIVGEAGVFRDMGGREMAMRFLGYFFYAFVLGYYADLARKQKRRLGTDTVTGVYNYQHFSQHLAKSARLARRYGEGFALVFIDIENFKSINNAYGRMLGNEVLKCFASVLRENLRDVDVVARYGGDEFIILLYHQDWQDTRAAVRRILQNASRLEMKYITLAGLRPRLNFSTGVAFFPASAEDPEKLVMAAGDSMRWAKRLGKNQICRCWGELTRSEGGYPGPERRSSMRFSVHTDRGELSIQYALSPAPGRFSVCNISTSGILIEGGTQFKRGDEISICFDGKNGLDKEVKLTAVAARASTANAAGRFETGFRFFSHEDSVIL